MIKFKQLIERFALYLLRKVGTPIIVYPLHMEGYRDEILALCKEEEKQEYSTDDILGSGYFKGRRVMSIMKKKYPFIKVRDLWKAVDILSEGM